MPTSYRIDPAKRVALTRGWGEVTDDEMLQYYLDLAADPEFDPGFCQLGDLTGVSRPSMSTATVRRAASLAVFHPSARRALVATKDVVFGVARMFAIMSDQHGQNVRVFRSKDEAVAWLTEERSDAA
jgi:hypothetical protein